MKGPVNLSGGVTFKNFTLKTDYAMVNDIWFKLNKRGLYEIDNNFGIISLDDTLYTMHRIVFLAQSETQIKGKQYPLEMQVEGLSKDGRRLIVSVLFKKSLLANPILMKLGIGVGVIKEIGQKVRFKGKKIKYRFSLNSLFRGNSQYVRYSGKIF